MQIRGYMCFLSKEVISDWLVFCISHLDKECLFYLYAIIYFKLGLWETCYRYKWGAWYLSAPFWMSRLKCPFLKIKSSFNQIKLKWNLSFFFSHVKFKAYIRNNTCIKKHWIFDMNNNVIYICRVLRELQLNDTSFKDPFSQILKY